MKIKLAILSSLLILNLSNAQKFSDHFNDKNTAISMKLGELEYTFNLKGIYPKADIIVMRALVGGLGRQAIKPEDITFSIHYRRDELRRILDFKHIKLGNCEKVLIYLKRIKKWFAIAKSEFTPNIALSKPASPPFIGIPFRVFQQERIGEQINAHFDFYNESDLEHAIELLEYLTLNSKDIEAHLLKESNRLNEKYKLLK